MYLFFEYVGAFTSMSLEHTNRADLIVGAVSGNRHDAAPCSVVDCENAYEL